MFRDETHLPAQVLIIHVPNKQRFGGKCIGLNIHICSCHLEGDKNDTFTVKNDTFPPNNLSMVPTLYQD